MKKILIALILIGTITQLKAQDYRLGKISKKELQEKAYPLDSSAVAAVLYKERKTSFEYRDDVGFLLITEVHERIKIYKKEGYDWATKEISYYTPRSGKSEKVSISDAKTFQLINGKIESQKLNKKDIFTEKINKSWSQNKFSMPNLSEGCIVEWEYRIESPYKSIEDVIVQYDIPIKKLICKIEIPEYYIYSIKQKGYLTINAINSVKNSQIVSSSKNRSFQNYNVSTSYDTQAVHFKTNVTTIDNENIPALLDEPYVNNINNYRAKVQFELASINWPNETTRFFSQSWEDVSKTINNDPDFGDELRKSSYFEDDLTNLRQKYTAKNELAIAIFEFVKGHVKWNNEKRLFTYDGVKEAYKTGAGNSAEVNLILVAMLRAAGIDANPVLVSTRDYGVPIFPTIDGFNYVIAAASIDDQLFLLDATEPLSTPNVLPLRDLNWQGRLVKKDGTSNWVNLMPSKKSEANSVVALTINEDGLVEGFDRETYTNLYALNFRNSYVNLSEEKRISKTEEANKGIEISEIKFSDEKNPYKPISSTFKFSSENLVDIVGNEIFFKPLLFNSLTKNPFKLEKREYPIDFGTPFSYKYMMNITIPDNYVVESMPESSVVSLPNNNGVFKFSISNSGNKISIFSIIQINTAIYPQTDYEYLKEFYRLAVAKNIEQIKLKKT